MIVTPHIQIVVARLLVVLVMMTAPVGMLLAQDVSNKFSMTTQMFMSELREQVNKPATYVQSTSRRSAAAVEKVPKKHPWIASPDTLGGVAYISSFIHLKDVNDLSAVRSLGVKIDATFDGMDFITAHVPVAQLEALSQVDNVTRINVAQLMRPTTDVARSLTHVDDLLTLSPDAASVGVNSLYDGTGVILGIIDTGIDFQHIAFKDKDGHSRIKGAYVYTGETSNVYTDAEQIASLTTDNEGEDHGTHTSSTAGGSSVIVNGSEVSVTNDHASATYGGMAPGADLYLAGLKVLLTTALAEALGKVVAYADSLDKPLVVSNSWGGGFGPHDGNDEMTQLVQQHFGDGHPNRVILFASSNDAGRSKGNDNGGFFVKKSEASKESPLGTIIRYSGSRGNKYDSYMAFAWSVQKPHCIIHVLNDKTGEILKSWECDGQANKTSVFSGLDTYYSGTLQVESGSSYGKYLLYLTANELVSKSEGDYTLAIELWTEGGKNIDMWGGTKSYFSSHLTTEGHTWLNGTDDMTVSDQATIADVISVGAYVSKSQVTNSQGNKITYLSGQEGDIAYFSSYATAEMSPTGLAYPWITAPGAQLVAGVNHFHSSGDGSYYGDNLSRLVVNNANNPYGVMQGTSMATPVASGIVALWLQAATEAGASLTANEVKDVMEQTAIQDEFTTGTYANRFGKGKIDALAGIRYIHQVYGGKLAIANSSDNSKAITTAAEDGTKTYDITLCGRTLYKDGKWNTLCLPFDLTIAGSALDGDNVVAMVLDGSASNLTNGVLNLKFDNASATIPAGTPFIIKWDSTGQNLTESNLVFPGVAISKDKNDVAFTGGAFKGTYTSTTFDHTDGDILFMGAINTLSFPKAGAKIGCCRAYFELDEGNNAKVRSMSLNFGTEGTTKITSPLSSIEEKGEWYTLSGLKLTGKPAAKGTYLHGGSIVVIN